MALSSFTTSTAARLPFSYSFSSSIPCFVFHLHYLSFPIIQHPHEYPFNTLNKDSLQQATTLTTHRTITRPSPPPFALTLLLHPLTYPFCSQYPDPSSLLLPLPHDSKNNHNNAIQQFTHSNPDPPTPPLNLHRHHRRIPPHLPNPESHKLHQRTPCLLYLGGCGLYLCLLGANEPSEATR